MYKAIINSLPGIDKEKVFLYHVMKYGPETAGDDVPGGPALEDLLMKKGMSRLSVRLLAVFSVLMFFLCGTFFLGPHLALGDDGVQTRQLVERARMTLESFAVAREMEGFRNLMKNARGIFVSPQILRGAFIVGASGGSGVFLVRDRHEGDWTGPAFYTIGEASFGLQIGGDASEVVLLAMTERGVMALLSNSVKLGADIGIAVGPVGAGADAATANLSADIISFSRSKGLYGGVSLEGAVVAVREGLNRAYYGRNVSPSDILIARSAKNDQAAGLLSMVTKIAGGKH